MLFFCNLFGKNSTNMSWSLLYVRIYAEYKTLSIETKKILYLPLQRKKSKFAHLTDDWNKGKSFASNPLFTNHR